MRVSVTEYGAAGDGVSLDTAALQQAIDAVHAAGGGVVTVPAGRYYIGTVFIRSFVTLELDPGAVLIGSDHWEDYPPITYRQVDRLCPDRLHRHLVVMQDAECATLTGRGLIDGGGHVFWQPAEHPAAWVRAKAERPDAMVAVVDSRGITVSDVRMTNPPNWTMDIYGSDRVLVHGVAIVNDHRTPNSDGIDISGSHDVRISDCVIDTGDDGIVINTRPRDVRRVEVTNCTICTDCAALKVGWEFTRFDIRQVTFSNCVISGSNRGIAFYTCNGATLEDVVASNIVFDSNSTVVLARPIHLDLRRGSDTGSFGAIRNVLIQNFVARTQGRILMTAEEGGWLENVTLRDIQLTYPYIEDPAPMAPGATSMQFSNANPDARAARAAIVAENLRHFTIEGLRIDWPGERVPEEWRVPIKRENGSARLHENDYANPTPCQFSVLWGRHLQQGRIDLRDACPSSPDTAACVLEESDITVIE